MKSEHLCEQCLRLREEWKNIRRERLALRRQMALAGAESRSIRRDSVFRTLRRRQKRISVLIRHLEMKINRLRARGER
jgi:hypothetical protein